MGNPLAFIQFAQSLVDRYYKVNAFQNILPGCILGEFINGLNRCFFRRHILIVSYIDHVCNNLVTTLKTKG